MKKYKCKECGKSFKKEQLNHNNCPFCGEHIEIWNTCPVCGLNPYDSSKYKMCYTCYQSEKGLVLCKICKKNYHSSKYPSCFECYEGYRR